MKSESFKCSRFQLDISYDEQIQKICLIDSYSGVAYADSDYRYSAYIESTNGITCLDGLYQPRVDEHISDKGGRIVIISGILGSGPLAGSIRVEHRFYIPEDDEYLEERLVLRNTGSVSLAVPGYRFGLRKRLAPSKQYGGPGVDIEHFRLVAVPFRLQPNGQKHDYQLDDMYNGRYQCAVSGDMHRFNASVDDDGRARSEGWAFTDGENGLLVMKYNPNMIEYSMLETETTGTTRHLNFGGAAPSLFGEPVNAGRLAAGGEIAFGKTRYHFYEGLWRRAYYLFRDFMSTMGHGIPDNYNPPVIWSVRSPDLQNTTPAEIVEEARRAKHVGCSAISLGSAWESVRGSAKWDIERLGEPTELLGTLKKDFGFEVNVNAGGRAYGDSFPGDYRKSVDGCIGFSSPYKENPFYEPCVCYKRYQNDLVKRLSEVVKHGVDYVTFREFDWRGPCYEQSHGHAMPSAPGIHGESVVEIVRHLKENHPQIGAKMDDPVWPSGVRYLPPYYLYDQGATFEEISAFGFSNDPLDALLSGKALALFYYNLAYDLPLTIRLDMTKDNDNCLAFWYYASTVRHLGICSSVFDQDRFDAYRNAIDTYTKLKTIYTQGVFYGWDELTHAHVLSEQSLCVINAFNITDVQVNKQLEVRLNDMGILDEVCVEGSNSCTVGNKLILNLDIPPFSSTIATIKPVH